MTPSPSTPPMNPERSDAILGMLSATIADDQDARIAARRRKRTRGIWIASMATAVVVVAAGVGYGVTAGSRSTAPGDGGGLAAPTSEPAEPTPSSTPTSSLPPGVDPAGTATPVPTPTPTANTPSDVSTWLITTDGVGPLTQGISLTDADGVGRAAGLTQTDCGAAVGVQGTHFYDLPDGTQLVVQPDGPGTTTISVVGSILSESKTGTVSTPHGIHIGSTLAELHATYPDLVPPKYATYPSESGFGLSDGAGHWIDFVVDNASGTVQEISVNTDNAIPSEFCG